jgi:hypothetical protein
MSHLHGINVYRRQSAQRPLKRPEVERALAFYHAARQAGGSYAVEAYRRDIDSLGEPIDVLRHRLHVVDKRAMVRLVNTLIASGYSTHVTWQPCQFPAQEVADA